MKEEKERRRTVKKIYLFCSAGMSTSMLASRMQSVAQDNRLAIKIKAFSFSKIVEIVEQEHPDCILLGPQVKHLYRENFAIYDAMGIPVTVIDAEDYGRLRGDKVLKTTLVFMKNYKKGRDAENEYCNDL